jgi:hypothetical protein
VDHLVGRASEPQFLEKYRTMGNNFHEQMLVDIVRAYHYGSRYLVEIEVIHPADMRVKESHDIALGLQMALEQEPEVERCFVHVDYMTRSEDEHDWMAYQEQAAMKEQIISKARFHQEQAAWHANQLESLKLGELGEISMETSPSP